MPKGLKRRSWIPAMVFIAALAAGCSGSGDLTSAERLQSSLAATWHEYRQAHALPGGGISAYIETPAGIFFASSGMAAGVDRNTRFRIASNTKTFTAAAIMLLHQQGLLNIDDTIGSLIPGTGAPYVPNTAPYNIPHKGSITIRQLLSHTAGVFDVTNAKIPAACPAPYADQDYGDYVMATDPNHPFTPAELVGVVATCQIDSGAAGAQYHYSNTGYSLLAVIIERVSGLPYDQFVTLNLLIPNGLSSTSIPMLGNDRTIPPPFNPGYLYAGGVLADVTEGNMSYNIAEGNILSTPADLARWVRRLYRGEAGLNAASVGAMKTLTPQSNGNYGLGTIYVSGLGYGHNGAHVGYLSLMVYDPAVDVTTILYFNIWDQDNLLTDQFPLLNTAARDARAAVGY